MVQQEFCIARLRNEQSPSALSIWNPRPLWNGPTTRPVLVCMHCIIRRNCVEKKPVDSARRLRSKSRTSQEHSRIALPWRTRPICFFPLTSRPVITRFTSSLRSRRNSEKTQRFCSADIICRVSVVAFRMLAALPSLPPCASGPNICLLAKLPFSIS